MDMDYAPYMVVKAETYPDRTVSVIGVPVPVGANLLCDVMPLRPGTLEPDPDARPVPAYVSSLKPFSGFRDESGNMMFRDDPVTLCGEPGHVRLLHGAFGVDTEKPVPWDRIWNLVRGRNVLRDRLEACMDGGFVSFWELASNLGIADACRALPGVRLVPDAGVD